MLLLESLTNAHRCWQQETGRYLKLKLEDRLLQGHARSQVHRALINSVCLCVSLTVCVSVRVCTCSLPGPTSPHQPPLFLSHAHTILRRERESVCRIFLHCICTRSVCMSLCVCVCVCLCMSCVCVFVCHVCVCDFPAFKKHRWRNWDESSRVRAPNSRRSPAASLYAHTHTSC